MNSQELVRTRIQDICYKWKMQFNQILLDENIDDFIKNTVPHEIAHIIDLSLHGKKNNYRTHGHNWQRIMILLGVEPETYHSYNTENSRVKRKSKRHIYECDCKSNMKHYITAKKHQRIVDGLIKSTCTECYMKIRWTGKIRNDK